MGKIREAQNDDKEIAEIKEKMSEGKAKGFREDEHGTLWFEDRIYVPNDPVIRKLMLEICPRGDNKLVIIIFPCS